MLPKEHLKAQLREEQLRLRRDPAADHRDPSGPPPPLLEWNQRTARRVDHDQYLIAIPCRRTTTVEGVDQALTSELHARWITTPGLRDGWHITCVSATYMSCAVQPGRLILTLTATIQTIGAPPLDNPAMARDLNAALT